MMVAFFFLCAQLARDVSCKCRAEPAVHVEWRHPRPVLVMHPEVAAWEQRRCEELALMGLR